MDGTMISFKNSWALLTYIHFGSMLMCFRISCQKARCKVASPDSVRSSTYIFRRTSLSQLAQSNLMANPPIQLHSWLTAVHRDRIVIIFPPMDDRIGFSANEHTDDCPLDELWTILEAKVLHLTQPMSPQAMVPEEKPEWHLQATYCCFASCCRTM